MLLFNEITYSKELFFIQFQISLQNYEEEKKIDTAKLHIKIDESLSLIRN